MSENGIQVDGGCVPVQGIVVGLLANNVYVVDDGAGGVIVCDPSENADAIMDSVAGRPVSALFVTHHHPDHIGALAQLKDITGAPVYATAADAPRIASPSSLLGDAPRGCTVDVELSDGDEVAIGATTWRVLATPGHTPGSCCYFLDPASCPGSAGAPLLLSGDTLFHASIGRTDLEGGNMDDMRASLRLLGTLPDETLVLPGHGELTSIGTERWRVIDFLGA